MFINTINEWLGNIASWLTLVMVFVTLAVVVLRYLFDIGYIWMQDLYIWIHGFLFMLGASYTLKHDAHVRVDLVYAKRGVIYKAWVNLLGTIFLLFPILSVVFWKSWPYVVKSWQQSETSMQAGGLPALYILKSVILIFCVLMFIQGLSTILTSLLVLTGKIKEPLDEEGPSHVG